MQKFLRTFIFLLLLLSSACASPASEAVGTAAPPSGGESGVAPPGLELIDQAGEPAVGEPAVGEPAVGEPAVDEPAAGQPAAGQPAVGQPVYVLAQTVGGAQVRPDCPDEMSLAVAQTVAADYPIHSETVIAWYCSGAEFEDILTALQTEAMVPPEDAIPAEEMLDLITHGFTWDEIWLVLGLTEF